VILRIEISVLPLPKELAYCKDAYLDLSKPYTYNWNNSPNYTKKDNQANKLLKQVGTTIGSAIGSTSQLVYNDFNQKTVSPIR
jgi:hypothetical protein